MNGNGRATRGRRCPPGRGTGARTEPRAPARDRRGAHGIPRSHGPPAPIRIFAAVHAPRPPTPPPMPRLPRFRDLASRAGYGLLERALWLHLAAQRPETPAWARSVIYGALGYLVLPADAVPDVLP